MTSPRAEALTAQFYEWEVLGRGWLFAQEPVDLEPPFTPFFGHFIRQQAIVDDGIHHTWLSSIASAFKKKTQVETIEYPSEPSYDLFQYIEHSALVTFKLQISKQGKANAHDIEQLLIMLSYCTRPISFEVIGTHTEIKVQFVCREEDASYIKSQLVTYLKGVTIIETPTEYESLVSQDLSFATVDFGLKEEFMRPIGLLKGSTIDPYTGMFSILEYLEEGEQVVFQVLFNGVVNHWQSSILTSVSDKKGGAFFEDAPEMVPLAKEKIGAPLCSATVRLLAQSHSLDESFSLLHKLCFALSTTSRSHTNSLLPLSDQQYTAVQRALDIIFRQSCRCGMLLNAKELATFVHLPESSLLSKKLIGENKKTKAAPSITEGHSFTLGQNSHNGIEKSVTVSTEQRLKHTHIIGATGTGKSTLLLHMISEDIKNGEGVAVLDPHGDLVEAILSCIPLARMRDVILIDPADSEYPVGFNILKAHSDIEKEVLSSDLVAAFKRLSTSWGDQMNSVFANAILAFLESTKTGTLVDMRRFLIEKSYREEFLKTVPDPSIIYYWQKEYPLLKTNSIGPILTRLDSFLRPRVIRNMVAQKQGIDFEKMLNDKKILLVKLSQGLIGAENSYLLGSFVVTKIHQAALARQTTQQRNDFFLYIDEFQHFITTSMAHILSGARKYHVGLIVSHQDLQQLQKVDTELLNTLITNAGTRICFRLGDADAKRLSEGFSSFDAQDLQNLGVGEAIVRIERPEYDFSLSTTPSASSTDGVATKEAVIAHSRQLYSTPKEKVEAVLNESMSIFKEEQHSDITPERHEPIPEKEEVKVSKRESKPSPMSWTTATDEEIKGVVQKKEETQHRYLQSLIKRVAESKGYKATIEKQTPDGKGSVDVSIEGHKQQIACEVSITTTSAWESHNISKCIDAGYNLVFVCCTDRKSVDKMIQQMGEFKSDKVIVGTPDMLFELLDKFILEPSSQTTIKGYRVNVEYDALSHDDMTRKRESIARVIMDAMKKKGK